jgi:hypothetical protein
MLRLSPQPVKVSMMIHKRTRVKEKRIENRRKYGEWLNDMKEEVGFLRRLGIDEAGSSWDSDLRPWLLEMEESFRRDTERSKMVFKEEDVLMVYALREKGIEGARQRRLARKAAAETTSQRAEKEEAR